MTKSRRILASVTVLFATLAGTGASALAQDPALAAGAPSAPPSAVASNGEYVAPLSQQTQPTYLPQSVALSGPRMIKDWQEGAPIPYGYHEETRARKGLVIGGGISFGVAYLYAGLFAAVRMDLVSNSGGQLFLPVAGPFILMAETNSATERYMLAVDGVAQAVGLAMFVYGLSSPKTVLIRNDLATVAWMPMPIGNDGRGVGLVGSF